MAFFLIPTEAEQLERKLSRMPPDWYARFKHEHQQTKRNKTLRDANLQLLDRVATLTDAERCGLRMDANDEDIKNKARKFARHFEARIKRAGDDVFERLCVLHNELAAAGFANLLAEYEKRIIGLVLRVQCESFWRRQMRKVFAKTIEALAIDMGFVNRKSDCYVSNQSMTRRKGQAAANAAILKATTIVNEYGQELSLEVLAAKGTSNKIIRHAELMTRISGFDLIAEGVGDDGLFITVTCPSRMHKYIGGYDGMPLLPNKNYDGTLPDEAQRYLSKQWSRARPALARKGVNVYGFRVAEPHHDGCPHWHLLLFFKNDAGQREKIEAVFDRYFLQNDSPTEKGAAKYRLKFELIDRAKGSAASYIAKYISKNTCGKGLELEDDLFGAPVMQSVSRVEAWAATWRARQFQQIGGAPVGVWRELRRLNPKVIDELGAGAELARAVRGANATAIGMPAAMGFAQYVAAQGGACVNRKHLKIKLLKQATGALNKYGEVQAADVIGVRFDGLELVTKKVMGHEVEIMQPVALEIESERCQWFAKGQVSLAQGAAARPWTRVNNCTQAERVIHSTDAAGLDSSCIKDDIHIVRSKTGKFFGGAGVQTIEEDNEKWLNTHMMRLRQQQKRRNITQAGAMLLAQ